MLLVALMHSLEDVVYMLRYLLSPMLKTSIFRKPIVIA